MFDIEYIGATRPVGCWFVNIIIMFHDGGANYSTFYEAIGTKLHIMLSTWRVDVLVIVFNFSVQNLYNLCVPRQRLWGYNKSNILEDL